MFAAQSMRSAKCWQNLEFNRNRDAKEGEENEWEKL